MPAVSLPETWASIQPAAEADTREHPCIDGQPGSTSSSTWLLQFHDHPAAPHPLQRECGALIRKRYGSGWNPLVNGMLGGWQIAVNGDWRGTG
jgi:hypothetical protein